MIRMEPRSRSVPGADGLSIHLLEWSHEGVALLLLHGFGNEAHIWDDFAPVVAPYYRTIAVDLRGHGDSAHDPDRRYDYQSHVRDLESITAELGIDRLVLVGHSFGGRISTLFAARHPQRLAGLVLVDAGPELDARGVSRISTDVKRSVDLSFASLAECENALAHAYPAAQPAAVERMARYGMRKREDSRYERKTDPAFHAARGELTTAAAEALEKKTTKELWDALGQITCPALVVRGAASDVLDPDTAERMAEEVLKNARLAVVPRAGHSVMTDNPEGFSEAVSRFALGDD
jgi:pimeloyl-ACP methyl ester carboxylesterase